MIKDSLGYFKLFSFLLFGEFKYFKFYIEIIEKVFLRISEQTKQEINGDVQKNKIFFLNVSQLIYGLESTFAYHPEIIKQISIFMTNFIEILINFLNEFNLLHIYTYCNIEEFLLENNEKNWEEIDYLSRSYTYRNGGLLLSITKILFYMLNSSLQNEEKALQIIKFIDQMLFYKSKRQNYETTLKQINADPNHERIRKWIENIKYFSGKKIPLIKIFSQVIILKQFKFLIFF